MQKYREYLERRTITKCESNYFLQYQSRSLRGAEQYLYVPQSSIHDSLRSRLQMFPYKLQVVEFLEKRDDTSRNGFLQWCLHNIQVNSSFLNRVIYSDWYVVNVDGRVNKHNAKIWGTENPHKTIQVDRDSKKTFGPRCLLINFLVRTTLTAP